MTFSMMVHNSVVLQQGTYKPVTLSTILHNSVFLQQGEDETATLSTILHNSIFLQQGTYKTATLGTILHNSVFLEQGEDETVTCTADDQTGLMSVQHGFNPALHNNRIVRVSSDLCALQSTTTALSG